MSEAEDLGIVRLVAQYFQLIDPKSLAIPPPCILKRPSVQDRIYKEMFDEDSLSPIIPPANYRLRVLKSIITRIEASEEWDPEEDEIIESLMTAFATLMSQPPDPSATDGKSTPQLSFVKYTLPTSQTPRSQHIITSESRGLLYGFGSTGFRTWEAALHLGTYLCSTETGQELIRGKRVLELGAGTGFVSLLCKKHLHAETMLMTDGNEKLVELFNTTCLTENKFADTKSIQGKVWEWGTPLSQEEGSPEPFDIAIGADLTYDTAIIPLLMDTVSILFTSYGVKKFVLSATIRNKDTFGAFLAACREYNFRIAKVPYESPPPEDQMGFFHETRIRICTYIVEP
ncbi:putative protein YJR129C [Talaromyces islandicus]|uniref:Uncharacterized protein n=1 Tax=Talaromyces islandicus TaxID=28573 RepID=A0A0U1M931_TALIS|nr:putative protein YJR129C [Talaromyces islandicus]